MSDINLRVVIVREGCQFCAMAKKAVNFVNNHLDDLKQIEIKDNEEFEIFGSKIHPIIDMFDRNDFDGYPFIYIDGIPVDPAPVELLIVTIANILEDDLISPISIGGKLIGL